MQRAPLDEWKKQHVAYFNDSAREWTPRGDEWISRDGAGTHGFRHDGKRWRRFYEQGVSAASLPGCARVVAGLVVLPWGGDAKQEALARKATEGKVSIAGCPSYQRWRPRESRVHGWKLVGDLTPARIEWPGGAVTGQTDKTTLLAASVEPQKTLTAKHAEALPWDAALDGFRGVADAVAWLPRGRHFLNVIAGTHRISLLGGVERLLDAQAAEAELKEEVGDLWRIVEDTHEGIGKHGARRRHGSAVRRLSKASQCTLEAAQAVEELAWIDLDEAPPCAVCLMPPREATNGLVLLDGRIVACDGVGARAMIQCD